MTVNSNVAAKRMDKNVFQVKIATPVAMVHMMMMVPLAVVHVSLMKLNAHTEKIVIYVAPTIAIGTRLERRNVVMNLVLLTEYFVSQVTVVQSVAVEGHLMVMVQSAVVNVFRLGLAAAT
jgi:hypothetical protein